MCKLFLLKTSLNLWKQTQEQQKQTMDCLEINGFGFYVCVMECIFAQTKPWFIILSSKRVLGNGIISHVNSKGKIPHYWRLRGGLNLLHCIMQDSEPDTLLTELFWPGLLFGISGSDLDLKLIQGHRGTRKGKVLQVLANDLTNF